MQRNPISILVGVLFVMVSLVGCGSKKNSEKTKEQLIKEAEKLIDSMSADELKEIRIPSGSKKDAKSQLKIEISAIEREAKKDVNEVESKTSSKLKENGKGKKGKAKQFFDLLARIVEKIIQEQKKKASK